MSDKSPSELSGNLTMREVPSVWCRYQERSTAGELPNTIDLGKIERTDSSALALLLEWQAQADAQRKEIRFDNPPESLRVIARLTEVESLLGWNQEQQGDNGG